MAPPSEEESRRNSELVALLGAFCFLLSAIEYSFPKPLPFMRLGLANLPILLAVDLLPLPSYFLLTLLKFIGMGLVSGTLFSYVALFAAAGSLMSALAMRATRKLLGRGVSHLGISVAGAMVSGGTQILLASVLVFGATALVVAPLFLGTSLVTGTALGLFAARFAARSRWYEDKLGRARSDGEASPRQALPPPPAAVPKRRPPRKIEEGRRRRAASWDAYFQPTPLATAGALVALGLLFQPDLPLKILLFALLLILVILSGTRLAPLPILLTVAGIVLANLAIPVGRVLFKLGPLVVTQTALLEGIGKAITFEGLLFISKISIRPGLRFPGRLGGLVAEALSLYERIQAAGLRPRPTRFVEDADLLLLGLETGAPAEKKQIIINNGRRGSRLALVAGVVVALVLLLAGRLFHP